MKLRHLTQADEQQALAAHHELAAEKFDFLLGFTPELSWTQFLKNTDNVRRGVDLPENLVPADFLVAEVAGDLVGRVSIRHRLNTHLRAVGGHIGYAVRPHFRQRGYAQEILRLSLIETRKLGLEQVLVTCDADNLASKAVIEKAGGVAERELPAESLAQNKLLYWIETIHG